MNPLGRHYHLCNTGTNAGKYAALPDFPHLIDIEPVGVCNFRCLMCPTGLGSVTRPQGLMTNRTWQRILGECAQHGTAIRMIGWGEPTLHPSLIDMVWDADAAGLLTHVNTNGSKLTRKYIEDLFDAGLSSLKFSFQGVDRESYREMRRVDFYEKLVDAIRLAREVRGSRDLPYLQVSTSTTYETPEQIEAFCAEVGPHVDAVTVGKTIFDYVDVQTIPLKQREKFRAAAALASDTKRHPNPCPEVYDKLSIHWDGSVAVCCNAYDKEGEFGNVNETPLSELWRHQAIEAYRERLSRDEYSGPLCGTCWHYMEGTA